ncbi:MAG: MerR family transcriptional regulator [Fibrobacter sp.]|jgi:DNA-binding transcriptional MerR regulator|nr:MerR family transcriptional regulator [Fibrobacter sp.]
MVNIKKAYYSISEVCSLTGLEPHVLRYWESEFSQLRPKKNRAGNRAYRQKDIDLVNYIKFLLYEEKFTIPGAKKKLSEIKEIPETGQMKPDLQLALDIPEEKPSQPSSQNAAENQKEYIDEIRKELTGILSILKE